MVAVPINISDPIDVVDTTCLLYTYDAADEGLGVDLGGRRTIKKKNRNIYTSNTRAATQNENETIT